MRRMLLVMAASVVFMACGDDSDDDSGGDIADELGVGAECAASSDCLMEGDGGINLVCLPQFKGGYCGLQDCTSNDDCLGESVCVIHDDGNNYCFRSCTDKAECNENRSEGNEANCSASVDYADAATTGKACVPPSN